MDERICDRMYWPEGRTKAVTFSYDDGVEQDRLLIEMLNTYGAKATFNLNTGLMGQEGTVGSGERTVSHNKIKTEEIKDVYAGHEIADHGKYHALLYGTDSLRCTEEIISCRRELEQITGKIISGYAHPYGAYDENVLYALKSCKMEYARTIESSHSFQIPKDFLIWHPTCHHDDDKLFELADAFLEDSEKFSYPGPAKLFYIWGHSYEFERNKNWDRMEDFLKKVTGREDVWYAANMEIVQYVEAYRRLKFSTDGKLVYNPSAEKVWIGNMYGSKVIGVGAGETVKTALAECQKTKN